ncbi:MAG: hypothetical protein WBF88_15685 [Pusillimonas sp.]
MSQLDTPPHADLPAEAVSEAVAILAEARSRCAQLGVAPAQLGDLFLDEAMLAWLLGDWDERAVRKRLMEAMSEDVRKWYARVKLATGQCDCVPEVHLSGLLEMEALERKPIFRLEGEGLTEEAQG